MERSRFRFQGSLVYENLWYPNKEDELIRAKYELFDIFLRTHTQTHHNLFTLEFNYLHVFISCTHAHTGKKLFAFGVARLGVFAENVLHGRSE